MDVDTAPVMETVLAFCYTAECPNETLHLYETTGEPAIRCERPVGGMVACGGCGNLLGDVRVVEDTEPVG